MIAYNIYQRKKEREQGRERERGEKRKRETETGWTSEIRVLA